MDERAHGLILRIRPLTDSSLIVHWLTREAGRLATVAQGARRPRSPWAGRLDLFHLADLSFHRRRGELHRLGEVQVTGRFPRLAADFAALQLAAYAVGAIEGVSETETPVPELWELLREFLGYLEGHPASARALFAFEVRLLASQGVEPRADTGAPARASTRELLEQLQLAPWADLPRLTAAPEAVHGLDAFLQRFLADHLGRLPRGRPAAWAALRDPAARPAPIGPVTGIAPAGSAAPQSTGPGPGAGASAAGR
ncbi:MAG: DNA repair protein RecO [Verrucomicrobiota bacterium]